MSVVVALGPVDHEVVRAVLGLRHQLVTEPTEADLASASAAIVRAHVTVDGPMLDRMPQLQVIARTGVGTERVDVIEAARRGIPVVVTPGSNTNAVAEGALTLGLHLIKHVSFMHNAVASGEWESRTRVVPGDIDGAVCGIVGWGRIGQRLGSVLTAMGATVIAFDPFAEIPDSMRVESMADVFTRSDFVSLHAPLTAHNRHMVNAKTLDRFRPGAVLVNCSRGPLIDLDAAHQALLSGRLGGLGLDVFDDEPPTIHPVFSHPNVVLSPHVSGLSARAATQTFHDAAVGILDVLEGRTPIAVAKVGAEA